MKRVLIWKKVNSGSEYDLYHTADNHQQIRSAISNGGYNFGNRLWLQGLMSAIDTGENEYSFLNDGLTDDVINNNFDFIIYPMANIFNKNYLHYICSSAEQMQNIKIPVFVIACGAQADSYDALDLLITDIGEESKLFIDSVYKTGGQFALRGNFTKAFFDRLGYSQAVTTGCPSMYQMGRDFTVNKHHEGICKNPAFNGKLTYLSKLIKLFPNSYYYDQDLFLQQLYCENYIKSFDFKALLSFYCNCGPEIANLLAKDRVKLFPEMCDWRNSIIYNRFDYSFGSRIHGNIMAILSGVPATVVAIDSRTREMAEFFDIPYVIPKKNTVFSEEDFMDAYQKADYARFNETFKQKYDAFEAFLVEHKIVSRINQNNLFFSNENGFEELSSVNIDDFKLFSKKLTQLKIPLMLCESILKLLKK